MKPNYLPIVISDSTVQRIPSIVTITAKEFAKTIQINNPIAVRRHFNNFLRHELNSAIPSQLKEWIKAIKTCSNYYKDRPVFVRLQTTQADPSNPLTEVSNVIRETGKNMVDAEESTNGQNKTGTLPGGQSSPCVGPIQGKSYVSSSLRSNISKDPTQGIYVPQGVPYNSINYGRKGPPIDCLKIPKKAEMKMLQKELTKLMDFGGDQDSIRRAPKKMLINFMMGRISLKKTERKEMGRRCVILMPDSSESCESISNVTVAVSRAASKLGNQGGDVYVLENYNMGKISRMYRNGKQVTRYGNSAERTCEEIEVVPYVKQIIKGGQDPLLIYMGDFDGMDELIKLTKLTRKILVMTRINKTRWDTSFAYFTKATPATLCDINETTVIPALITLLRTQK